MTARPHATEKLLFYLLIFLIPLSTRKLLFVWWEGEYSEYLSAFLYATDIVVALLVFFWVARAIRGGVSFVPSPSALIFLLGGMWLVGLVSLFNAKNVPLGFYQLIKLGEGMWVFWYIKTYFRGLNTRTAAGVFAASGVLQSLWAMAQFSTQSDFGLKFLGESPLHPDLPYVANFFVDGVKIIRAYAGFPHPNVLAAFLVAAIFSLYLWFLLGQKDNTKNEKAISFFPGVALGAGFFVLLSGLIATFSRVALGAYFAGSIAFFLFCTLNPALRSRFLSRIRTLIVVFSVCNILLFFLFSPYLFSRFTLDPQEEAVTHRLEYGREAASQIKTHRILGVGMGNFIPVFRESLAGKPEGFYQPVHNIYLLVASELGVAGLSIFIVFLLHLFLRAYGRTRSMRDREEALLVSAYGVLSLVLLATGFFDHFLWTLQQGRLLFWVVLGVFAALIHQKERGGIYDHFKNLLVSVNKKG